MSNTLVTCSIVAKESLAVLENMLSFSQNVNRDWEAEFTNNMSRGYAPGQTINIKKPPRYSYRAGRVAVPQSTVETTVPLTLSQGGCDINFTSAERTLSLTKLEDKIMAAMAPVANEIDRQGFDLARTASFNALNASGALPTTQALAIQAIGDMNQRLDDMGAPRDKRRSLIMSPSLNNAVLQGMAGMFNAADVLSKQFGNGMVQNSYGLQMGMDQNAPLHTNGTQAAGPTANAVNGASQTGSSITVNGAAITGTILKGSVISFGGVNAVNPQNRTSTGQAAQFVVTADVAAAATSIPISPALTSSGAFQNVDASPANNATLTVHGTASTAYRQSVAFHKDAFTLAMVPLWAPPDGKGVIDCASEEHKGFRIRVLEYWDGTNDASIMRLDVMFGWACPYPELSVRYYTTN